MREALRIGVRRASALRDGDGSPLVLAVRSASDLLAVDPASALRDAIIAAALDGYLAQVPQPDSRVSLLSWELETMWRKLVHQYSRAVIQSLMGRESPSATRLRAMAESMERVLGPSPLGMTEYLVYP